MRFVNYGGPVRFTVIQNTVTLGGREYIVSGSRAQHDGPDGHELLQPGEYCECGQLGIGILPPEATEPCVRPGCDWTEFEL